VLEGDWVTWPEAAAIVGCPVPTIDWYTRLGRIEKRPFQGRRPTLKRTSVVEFAGWWRDRQSRQEARRRERQARQTGGRADPQPPSPTGWLSTQDAADILGVAAGQVPWLIGRGHLEGELHNRRWWVREGSVDELARRRAEEAQWVSAAEAARAVGCSQSVILRAANRGEIVQRKVERQRPSLSRPSVQAFQQTWAARLRERAERRERRPASWPPDDEHTWLTTREVADLLGVSRSRVDQLARAERLPVVRRAGRHWFRADHLQLFRNARRAQRQLEQGSLAIS
jgi:excisionase family DNA binding protein